MKITILIGLIGFLVLFYSFTLEPYTNTDEFFTKYNDMNAGQSNEFFKLRNEMLTPKYRLQDTGLTLIFFAMVFMLFITDSGRILSPSKKSTIIAIAFLLPLITVAGYIFDLFQGMSRDEFPRWADSLGIPLMGVPVEFVILLTWSLLHLLFAKDYRALPLSAAFSKKLNLWLMFISGATILFILLSMYFGQYWYALPGVIWIYYYLSIGVNRIFLQDKNKSHLNN